MESCFGKRHSSQSVGQGTWRREQGDPSEAEGGRPVRCCAEPHEHVVARIGRVGARMVQRRRCRGGTAVETAAQVEVAAKPKATRSRKKKETSTESTEPPESTTAVAEAAPPRPNPWPPKQPAPETKSPGFGRGQEAAGRTRAGDSRRPPSPGHPWWPLRPPPPARPGPGHDQARGCRGAAANAAPGAPSPPAAWPSTFARTRPTVTLASRAAATSPPERKAVVQAPQLTSLQPAKIQGPRVVRIEKQEATEQRGPRRPPRRRRSPRRHPRRSARRPRREDRR